LLEQVEYAARALNGSQAPRVMNTYIYPPHTRRFMEQPITALETKGVQRILWEFWRDQTALAEGEE
tara:strand:+ start:231 stop:428 length:198 start_codon:yes stop_codon:yes gene_type:complete